METEPSPSESAALIARRQRPRTVRHPGPAPGSWSPAAGPPTRGHLARAVDPDLRVQPATFAHLESAPRSGGDRALSHFHPSRSGTFFTPDQSAVSLGEQG